MRVKAREVCFLRTKPFVKRRGNNFQVLLLSCWLLYRNVVVGVALHEFVVGILWIPVAVI
jgi:hypothetical protein